MKNNAFNRIITNKTNVTIGIAVLIVALIGYYIYRQGKKAGDREAKDGILDLPNGGKDLTTGFDERAARTLAEQAHKVITGWFVPGNDKIVVYKKLLSLTDDELAYTANAYLLAYDEPLLDAVRSEWFAVGTLSELRGKLTNRLAGLR